MCLAAYGRSDIITGDRAAGGVGPYRENDMCGREMKEM